MLVNNYVDAVKKEGQSYKGKGTVSSSRIYSFDDFESPLKFFYYTEIPPGSSIGYHKHENNEEVYVVIEGRGLMSTNDEVREVKAGDVILNKPFWSHGLENHTENELLKILVFEADVVEGGKIK